MALKITRNSLLCSEVGGSVEIVNADGQLVSLFSIPAGAIPAKRYLALVPPGGLLLVTSDVTVYEPPSAIQIARHPQMFETGANPDFQPMSNAQRLEEQMRSQLRQMSKATKRIEARAAAFERMERIQPAPEPVEVLEPLEQPEEVAKE